MSILFEQCRAGSWDGHAVLGLPVLPGFAAGELRLDALIRPVVARPAHLVRVTGQAPYQEELAQVLFH
jgi:hypothetical protein